MYYVQKCMKLAPGATFRDYTLDIAGAAKTVAFESPTLRHLTTQVVDLKRKSHIIIDLKPYRACAPSAWRAPRSPLYTPFTLQNGKYLTTGKLLFLLLSI
jgi:hypothetical protein